MSPTIEGGRIKCPKGQIRDRREGMMGSHKCRVKTGASRRRSKCPKGMRKDLRKGKTGCRSNKSRSVRRFLRKNAHMQSKSR